MRVVFVNPSLQGREQNEFRNIPMSLITLASFVREYIHNLDIVVMDEVAGDTTEKITELDPDYICISAMTPFANDMYRIGKWCKKNSDATVIMGGSHASGAPLEAKQYCDIVIVGEGELALYDIIGNEGIDKDEVLGVEGIYRYPILKDLDQIPIPARDLIDMEFYINQEEVVMTGVDMRAASLITSRGCPFKCTFCYNSKRQSPIRYHSTERVVNEIEALITKYKVQGIGFLDDCFVLNKKRLYEIFDKIEERNLKFAWNCQARADLVDKEFLDRVKKVGCKQLGFGLESGSQKMLDSMGKQTTVEANRTAIKLCNEAEIEVRGCFVLGLPGETKETLKETEDFIDSTKINIISPFLATTFPGTKLWDYCMEKNLIPKDLNWNDFTTSMDVDPFCCDTMDKEELKKIYTRMNIKYRFKTHGKLNVIKKAIKHPKVALDHLGRYMGVR